MFKLTAVQGLGAEASLQYIQRYTLSTYQHARPFTKYMNTKYSKVLAFEELAIFKKKMAQMNQTRVKDSEKD